MDRSEKVTYKEFHHVWRVQLGLTPRDVPDGDIEAVFDAIDVDGDGELSISEFSSFARGAEHAGKPFFFVVVGLMGS